MTAPETASFSCCYLLLQATLTKPVSFLRLGGKPLCLLCLQVHPVF